MNVEGGWPLFTTPSLRTIAHNRRLSRYVSTDERLLEIIVHMFHHRRISTAPLANNANRPNSKPNLHRLIPIGYFI